MPCTTDIPGPANVSIPAAGGPMRGMPCHGKASDCGKQLGCLCAPGLPTQASIVGSPDFHTAVHYWPEAAALGGLLLPPDPFPPRAG